MSYDSALEPLRNAGAQKNQAASDGETPLLIAAVNNQRLVGQGMLRNASPAAKVRWGLRALSKVAHLSILGGARRGCAAGRTLTEATGRFVSLSCWIIACCSGVWFRSCAFRLVNLASSWPGGNAMLSKALDGTTPLSIATQSGSIEEVPRPETEDFQNAQPLQPIPGASSRGCASRCRGQRLRWDAAVHGS